MPTPLDQPWTLTLRQYERAIMDDFMDGLDSDEMISKAEYLRLYPKDSRMSEWWEELLAAVRDHKIPHRVLDDLFRRDERGGWTVLAIMQSAEVDHTYLPPKTRAAHAARRKEDAAASRRIRAEVRIDMPAKRRPDQRAVVCRDCHVECGPENRCPCCQAIARDRVESGN